MDKKLNILVIEDEKYIAKFIETSLVKEGYNVRTADTAKGGMLVYASHNPDIIMLDLGLPDIDGIELIREIRTSSDVPIIVVSAREQERNKIEALDNGANDYITKPFYMGELLARVRVVGRMLERNSRPGPESIWSCGGLTVEYDRHRVSVDGEEVHLTPLEYKLLCLLVANQGKVLTHSHIMKQVWGYDSGDTKSIRAFMASLRRKVEKSPASPRYILTEIGVGYRFSDE